MLLADVDALYIGFVVKSAVLRLEIQGRKRKRLPLKQGNTCSTILPSETESTVTTRQRKLVQILYCASKALGEKLRSVEDDVFTFDAKLVHLTHKQLVRWAKETVITCNPKSCGFMHRLRKDVEELRVVDWNEYGLICSEKRFNLDFFVKVLDRHELVYHVTPTLRAQRVHGWVLPTGMHVVLHIDNTYPFSAKGAYTFPMKTKVCLPGKPHEAQARYQRDVCSYLEWVTASPAMKLTHFCMLVMELVSILFSIRTRDKPPGGVDKAVFEAFIQAPPPGVQTSHWVAIALAADRPLPFLGVR